MSRSRARSWPWASAAVVAFCLTTASAGEPIAGRGTPPDGRTLLFIGQDSGTIAAYAKALPEYPPMGVTLYTGLESAVPEETLDGILSFRDRGAGEISFQRTLEQFPGAALAIGLSITDAPECAGRHVAGIVDGGYDATVGAFVDYLVGLAPRPVFLRIGYEFDGPWNCYRPESYKQAFRRLRQRLDAGGAEHVATVWQSATWPDPSIAGDNAGRYDHRAPKHLERWYPGDDVVDWVALSIFYNDVSTWSYQPPDEPRRLHRAVLDFARARGKPVMIAECAPQGYRTGALTRSSIHRNDPQPVTAKEIWEGWYQPFFDFAFAHRDVVRAVAYINTHWDAQGMWVCQPGVPAGQQGCSNGNWGDSRVQANAEIQARWIREISDPRKWVTAPSPEESPP